MVEKINEEQFEELLNGKKPVVCDFYADWCGPCKMLAPVLDKTSEKFAEAAFVKVNVDECAALAARYKIASIPFVAVFKGGALTAKTLGYMTETEAESFVKESL